MGKLGLSNNYSLNGITITAYGFIKLPKNDIQTNLYANNTFSNMNGLGMTIDVNHKINKSTYIQLDLSGINHKLVDGSLPNITIKDIQDKGGFSLYGSNTLGSQGILLYSSKDNPSTQTISIPKDYNYISVTAFGNSDTSSVILHSIEYVICKEYLYNRKPNIPSNPIPNTIPNN